MTSRPDRHPRDEHHDEHSRPRTGARAVSAEAALVTHLVADLRREVAARLAISPPPGGNGLTGSQAGAHEALARRLVTEALDRYATASLSAGREVLDSTTEARIERAVLDGILGLGGLQRWLDDVDVENVNVNGCDRVFIRYADGTRARVAPVAATDEELVDLVRLVAARAGLEERRFDRGAPGLNLRLPGGARMFAVMAVSGRPCVAIRRHRYLDVTLDDLVGLGEIDDALAAQLSALVRARKNILIAGGVATGKTTLLRALAAEIDPDERLITIEDTLELGLDTDLDLHPDVVALQAREANIEGAGAVELAELVRWALRMSPDRVIIGEVRGAELIPMLNAMSQGNDGSLSTLHSSTSAGVFDKLAAYAAQAPERLSREATTLLVAAASRSRDDARYPRSCPTCTARSSTTSTSGRQIPPVHSHEVANDCDRSEGGPAVRARARALPPATPPLRLRAAVARPGRFSASFCRPVTPTSGAHRCGLCPLRAHTAPDKVPQTAENPRSKALTWGFTGAACGERTTTPTAVTCRNAELVIQENTLLNPIPSDEQRRPATWG